jgi:hypothetical protein
MATKIYFGPYVRGPERNSHGGETDRIGGWNRLFKKMRTLVWADSNSRDRPPTAAPSNRRGHWAYRVANCRQSAPAEQSRECQPPTPLAVEVRDLAVEAVAPEQLRPGDVIVVAAGQTIFADGTILAGTAIVDESAITGQSEPLVCSAEIRPGIMRDSCLVAGQVLIKVADRRGHPLDWIETPSTANVLTQSALRRAAIQP